MLEQAIGRLLMIGLEQSAWDERLAELLREVQPGGVIFYGHNAAGGVEGFQELVGRVRETLGPRAFLAADLEGGTVDPLRELVGHFPATHSATQAHDDPLVRRFGALAGEALHALGLNTNFAPVLDLASPVLGTRAASAAPSEVLRFARNFLEGLSRHGVLGCGKHFPGLGGAMADTHTELAVVEKDSNKLWEEDLLPFRELSSELPLVMVAHAFYPALEPEGTAPRPASLSPDIVTGLLRNKLGFHGLIVSDDLEMGGALAGRSIGEAAIAAVEAGCQILLVCRSVENIRAARQALLGRGAQFPAFGDLIRGLATEVDAFAAKNLKGLPWAPASKPALEDLRKRIASLRHAVEGMEALHVLPLGTSGMAPARRGRPAGGGGGRRPGGRGRPPRGGRREGGEGREARPRGPRGPRGPRPPRRTP